MNSHHKTIIAIASVCSLAALGGGLLCRNGLEEPRQELSSRIKDADKNSKPAFSNNLKKSEISSTAPQQNPLVVEHSRFIELEEKNLSNAKQELDTEILAPMPFALQVAQPWRVFRQPDQIKAVQAIRDQFNKAMRTAGRPESPEYLEHWMAEQEKADERLMAFLGPEAFNQMAKAVK